MLVVFRLLLSSLSRSFRNRQSLLLENLALRQQLTVLKAKKRRPRLNAIDKLFWVLARKFWSGWKNSLIIVTPETVVRWHRSGFRLYWRWISRTGIRVGRKRISKELRDLIFQMVAEERAYQKHDSEFAFSFNVNRKLDNLRTDPRFADLLRRLGFPS